MRFIGRYGEYTVLTRLLAHDIEAYPAIKVNQDSYDLTAISKAGRAIRIEVKSTDLHNESTNNTIGKLARVFDFLIVVVLDNESTDCYVLTHAEALAFKGASKQLGISRSKKRKKEEVKQKEVKPYLLPHRERWDRIYNFEPKRARSAADLHDHSRSS